MRVAGATLAVAGAAQEVAGLTNTTMGLGPAIMKGDTRQMEKGMNQAETGYELGSAGNDLYEYASQRYKATQATKENLYIASEMPEGNGLLVWKKDRGEISKQIYFRDITPQFVVDEAADRVYVVVGSTIKAYDLH